MELPIACMICAVDPTTTSLLLPLAQATLISAPILLRGRIIRGIRSARAQRRSSAPEPITNASTATSEPNEGR